MTFTIDGQVHLVRLVRLQTNIFHLCLRQRKPQTSVCLLNTEMEVCFPWSVNDKQ
jgi:hypothetical protein